MNVKMVVLMDSLKMTVVEERLEEFVQNATTLALLVLKMEIIAKVVKMMDTMLMIQLLLTNV